MNLYYHIENRIQNDRANKFFIIYMIFHICVFQLLSVLRAAAIYNVAYIINYSSLFISSIMLLNIFRYMSFYKIRFGEAVLTIVPIFHLLYGILNNGISRDLFADTYNAIFFILFIVYVRHCNFEKYSKYYKSLTKYLSISLVVSLVVYSSMSFLGIKVVSVGKTSTPFVFAFLYFLCARKNISTAVYFLLLLLASKRGVLLSALSSVSIYILLQKKVKISLKLLFLIFIFIILILVLYFSYSSETVQMLPQSIRGMFYRIMFINPFSPRVNYYADGRLNEIVSCIRTLNENPLFFLIGKGPGFTYDLYNQYGNLILEDYRNVHFSPISILGKYGIIYTFFLYMLCFKAVLLNIKRFFIDEISIERKIFFLYVIAAFVNSFTAFTIYADYLFILGIGILLTKIEQNKGDINERKQN